jgi:hypothetical protein
MWTRLKVKYSQLKYRSKLRTNERRQLKDQIRYLRQANEKLRLQCEAYRLQLEPHAVFNHHYPAQMMALAVFMVLRGASLRCAAASVSFYAELMGWQGRFNEPCASTIRNWVCRCGLHALRYSKNLSGDYVAILDESIQIGKEKLLLMLGVPIKEGQSYCQALTSQDVVVLGMEVQTSWTGEAIAAFITRRISQHPHVRILYLLSDQGTSIKAAVKRLNIKWVSDCSHVMMNAVKALFEHDLALSEFSAQVGQLRRRLILTDFAILLPATLRDKDRFLRLFTLVEWADRMDRWWPKLCPQAKAHLQFYRKAWPLLRALRQVRYLIILCSSILKTAGLSQASYQRWVEGVAEFKQSTSRITTQANGFLKIMDNYFKAHANIYQDQNQILCCSDIIESTFGRYKNKGGMKVISADVLSIALYSQPISIEFIEQAMTKVSGSDIDTWQQCYVCHNRYGLIHRMKQELKSVE